jgi:hypothetical protein
VRNRSHASIRAILTALTRVESACKGVDRTGVLAPDELDNDPTRGARGTAQ